MAYVYSCVTPLQLPINLELVFVRGKKRCAGQGESDVQALDTWTSLRSGFVTMLFTVVLDLYILSASATGSWDRAAAQAITQLEPSQRPFAADQQGGEQRWLQDASTPL